MKLEYPLNEALPNIDNARDRLLAKIFRFRKEEQDATGVTDQDFELLYAYGKSFDSTQSGNGNSPTSMYVYADPPSPSPHLALVTGQLSKEITDVGREIEALFGVLNEEVLQLQ